MALLSVLAKLFVCKGKLLSHSAPASNMNTTTLAYLARAIFYIQEGHHKVASICSEAINIRAQAGLPRSI